MPDDGHRYEVLDGALLVTPAPGTAHQVCVLALAVLLRQHRRPGDIVMIAPVRCLPSSMTPVVERERRLVRRG